MQTKPMRVFRNVRLVPNLENQVEDRLNLRVTKNDVPTDVYWKARFLEGAIELENRPINKTPKSTSTKKDNNDKPTTDEVKS